MKRNRRFENGERLPKKITSLSSKKNKPTKKEKALAVYELRQKYKITALLRKAELSKSTYYDIISKLSKPDKYEEVKEVIKQIYHSNKGRYGYCRVTK